MPDTALQRLFRRGAPVLALLALVFGAPGAYADLTQTVINTNDSGAGSLRQAIIDSNAASGTSIINFALVGAACSFSGTICTITPATALPVITHPVTIDATTQSGYALTTPKIVISGASVPAATGLDITAGNSTVKGLVISGFTYQISLTSNGNNTVQQCFINLTSAGTAKIAAAHGIYVGSDNNLIGGATAASRNVLSSLSESIYLAGAHNTVSFNYVGTTVSGAAALSAGNKGIYSTGTNNTIGPGNVVSAAVSHGILEEGIDDVIIGNYIGTNAAGTAALSNGSTGIFVDWGSGVRIGGLTAADRNVISGNTLRTGIDVESSAPVLIQGNYIGTNAAGTAALANAIGIQLTFGNGAVIGGTTAAARNVISGNSSIGIEFQVAGVVGVVVQGNHIGVRPDGTTALPNGKGIEISFSNAPITIGGVAAGAGNVIARNTAEGIKIWDDATQVSIRGNAIHHNGALGIDLNTDGVTGNDGAFILDGTQANNGIDYPIFTTVGVIASTLQVAGYVGSAANQSAFANVLVDVYLASDDGNNNGVVVSGDGQSVGHGEGQTYLGTVTTDANGNFSGSFTIASTVNIGDKVTGTATDASGNTSEFGPNITVILGTTVLVSEYRFEESSWTGAAGEVKDSSGNNLHGQAIGSPLPTPASASPARAGSPGTCGYATLPGPSNSGGAFTVTGLPVSTTAGAQTSVAFWLYYTDIGTTIIPIGWNYYNLQLTANQIGFGTFNSDRYGTAASLAGGWHHIVAVFTNGTITNNQLYIDGVSQTLSQLLGSPFAAYVVVSSGMYIGGTPFSPNYRITGRIDDLRIYNGVLSGADVATIYAATHACPNSPAASFNCVESGATAASGHLYTKLAGTLFSVDVVALKADNSVETGYAAGVDQAVTVELVDGSGGTACGSRAAVNPAVSQTLTFSAANTGRKAASMTVSKAYADLRCRVTDANQTPNIVACSSDDFTVRPSALSVASTASADATGVSTSATPRIKTGASFTLTADSAVVGYDGTPAINTGTLAAHSGAVQAGTLSGSFASANAATGIATGAAFAYSEVGYFRLGSTGVYDNTFTAVDSAAGDCTNDFSNALVGGQYGCKFGNTSATSYFGRFIPDHLALAPGAATPACGGFSYFGQDGFTTAFSLTAQNSGNTTTQNYTGSWAKLSLGTWSNYGFASAGLPAGATLAASATAPTGSWNSGGASIVAKHQISRPSALTGQTSATLTALPADSDGVTLILGSAVPVSGSPAVLRYGRLRLSNKFGSEKSALGLPVQAQYWSGSSWVINDGDSCTTVPANAFALSGGIAANTSAAALTLVAGNGTVTLAAPSPQAVGYVDVAANLGSSGVDQSCLSSHGGTAANRPWLRAQNGACAATYDRDPSARATFGMRSPESRKIIHVREMF